MTTELPPQRSESPPWDAKRSQSPRGRWRKRITWTLVLGLVGFVVYGLKGKPILVEMTAVTHGPLTVEVVEEGKTRIRNRYVVAAPVTGQMHRVLLKAGDAVKANETVLTTIEPQISPLLDVRTKAQASAAVEMAQASAQKAEEALQMAQTAAEFAATNWRRIKTSERPGSYSLMERDNAERDAAMRQREVRANEFALKVAKFEMAQTKAALLEVDAPGDGKLVEVKSPVSGVVLKVQQESAAVIVAGAALVEVGDPEDLEIEAEILSRDAVNIQAGASVVIEQWGGETPLQGRVRRIEPAAFTKVSALGVEEQRVIVLSDLVNPPPAAKAVGDRFRVEVRVAVWHSDEVLLVPTGALFREGSEWMTFVFQGGRAKKEKVVVGHANGRFTEVLSGLQVGEQVLLHPPDTVLDGTTVKPRS